MVEENKGKKGAKDGVDQDAELAAKEAADKAAAELAAKEAADKAAAQDALAADEVVVTSPKAFKLMLDHHNVISVSKGPQRMKREHAEHWYCKANGVQVV